MVSRRVAMAAFGGAFAGGLVELLTDRTPGPSATPAGSPVGSAAATNAGPGTLGASATDRPTVPTTASVSASTQPTSTEVPPQPGGGSTFAASDALTSALSAVPRGKHIAFGVGLRDAATGRSFLYAVGAPFEMASTVKVDILVATYVRAMDAGRTLTANEKKLAASMIRNSDNTAATTLFRAAGRSPGMTAVYERMGKRETRSNSSWGLTTTTPGDRLVVLDALARGGGALRAEDGAEILSLMRTVATNQRWGVGGAARPLETVAVKNGWLPRATQGGRWIVSTSGLLTGGSSDLRLAVCSRGHASQSAGITFVEQVLRLAREQLGV